jgi:outer membrane receptor protein involved in Fe transport
MRGIGQSLPCLLVMIVVGAQVWGIKPAWAEDPEEQTDSGSDLLDFDLESLLETPIVQVGSRREQALDEAPSSITVITAEEIEAYGATNLAEVLRLVPGVYVKQDAGNHYVVGLRGVSRQMNNRLLIRLDGRYLSERLAGNQPWSSLPFQLGDVERIEIIRGPGSTLYGADALSGVINIITKRATKNHGFDIHTWGQLDVLSKHVDGLSEGDWVQNGGGVHLAYNWRNSDKKLGVRTSFGWNRLPEWTDKQADYKHGPFQYSANLSLDYQPSSELKLFASLVHSQAEYIWISEGIPSVTQDTRVAFAFQLEKKKFFWDSLTFKADANGRWMKVNFTSLTDEESLGAKVEGKSASDEANVMLQLDLSLFEGRNVLTAGYETTVFGVEEFSTTPWYLYSAVVLNNETRFLSDSSLILSLSGRFEQIIAREDKFGDVTYRHFSPRAALIWKLAEDHSLRFSYASAYRTPTPFEAYVDLTMLSGPDEEGPAPRAQIGNPQLRPEQVYSLEAGYHGLLMSLFRLEAVVFAQRINGLIDSVHENVTPLYQVNSESIEQVGIELGLRYNPSKALSTYLNYCFTYSREQESQEQIKDWPLHIYGLGAEFRLSPQDRINLGAYMIFDYQPTVMEWSGAETGMPVSFWKKIQAPDQAIINLRFGHFFLEHQAEVYLAVKNLLGFFRDPPGLKMYPQNNMQPIGGMILVGLKVLGT